MNALDLAAAHPGDRNRLLELATEAGIAAAPWAAGKCTSLGMHAFHECRSLVLEKRSDYIGF